jgi:hypothetical protein
MPRMYRAMTRDEDGKPLIGATARTLGVRIRPEREAGGDIPIVEGFVTSGTGGMSVSPEWWLLPVWRIPRRYDILGKGFVGQGKVEDACWRMGDGSFTDGTVSDRLRLSVDKPTHGTLQPSERMHIDEYQAALAETRDSWIEEPGT